MTDKRLISIEIITVDGVVDWVSVSQKPFPSTPAKVLIKNKKEKKPKR